MPGAADERTPTPRRVLIVDDDGELARALARMLGDRGFSVSIATSVAEALGYMSAPLEVVLLDLVLPDGNGMEILRSLKSTRADTEVVMMTAYGDVDAAVEAVRAGAFHFLTKPFASLEAVGLIVDKAAERRALISQARYLEEALDGVERGFDLIGSSPAMQRVFGYVRTVAHSTSTVLLEGGSGTGKELVARAIHHLGPRRKGPFVPVNCSAIPEHLIESEMFGHVRGAFTGAATSRRGLFEAANGGTLFLDEVADLPQLAQVKLLRALQEGEIRPVGSDETHRVDVRVVSATNADLRSAMEEGRFREDLFYRLNVITISLPPLGEREGDIELLAQHFLRKYGSRAGRPLTGLSPEAVALLRSRSWPGNVRELENAIERAVVLARDQVLRPEDFEDPAKVPPSRAKTSVEPEGGLARLPFRDAKEMAIQRFEQSYVQALLDATEGNVSEAARRAGLDRANFKRILKRCKSHVP